MIVLLILGLDISEVSFLYIQRLVSLHLYIIVSWKQARKSNRLRFPSCFLRKVIKFQSYKDFPI
ncbi:hypothetical protein BDE02_11G148100 [Populus trichocarpa]|nr:hypothetical protein BDE02_11G148100 [Populus trichocarpa]